MGLLRNLRRFAPKAKQLAEDNADKISENVDKVTDKINERTGGKYRDKLDKVDDAAKKFAERSGPDTGHSGDDPADGDGPRPS